MTKVFSSANITYVKWDMNRTFTDYYSGALRETDAGALEQKNIGTTRQAALSVTRQGEAAHRYMIGLYRVMKILTEKFPHILFEGCAAGGNRFDLGILCYFPQIWASDNTDAM